MMNRNRPEVSVFSRSTSTDLLLPWTGPTYDDALCVFWAPCWTRSVFRYSYS